MPDFDTREKRFEQDIEASLLTHGGYQKGNPAAFDRERALDTGTFLAFIRASQPKQWSATPASMARTASASSSSASAGRSGWWGF